MVYRSDPLKITSETPAVAGVSSAGPPKVKVRAMVCVELQVEDFDKVSDIIAEVWSNGDPEDTYNACIFC